MSKKKGVTQKSTAQKEEEKTIRCGFYAAVDLDGNMYFNIVGSKPDMVTLQGLLGYAELNINDMWKSRLNQNVKEGGEES